MMPNLGIRLERANHFLYRNSDRQRYYEDRARVILSFVDVILIGMGL
jgi:hypothetical protein